MASSNKTPHYQLSQFAPTDKPAWQGDYNSDMKKIDNGIYAAQNKADSLDASVSEAENKATQALEKAEAAEDAAENAAALAQEAKTTADNISGDLSGKVNKAGDTMTGPLVLSGDPTQPMEAATKQYVDTAISGIPTGGTGQLLPSKTNNISAFNSLMCVNALMGNLLFITFACDPKQTIAANTLLFSITLPAGMTMVEEKILGWPGWSTGGYDVKFDFVPTTSGADQIVQVKRNSEGTLDSGETYFCNYILELKNKEE